MSEEQIAEPTEVLETGVTDSANPVDNGDEGQKPRDEMPKGYKRSIDRLTRQTREAQEELRAAMAEIERLKASNAPKEELSDEERIIREAERRIESKTEERRRIESAQAEFNGKIDNLWKGIEELDKSDSGAYEAARELVEDFSKVQIPQETLSEILDSDQAAQIFVHFARNPDELSKVVKMTPIQTARYLTRLEIKLEGTAQPKGEEPAKSGAKPTPQSKSNEPNYKKSPDDMSTKEWVAYRRAELEKKAKR